MDCTKARELMWEDELSEEFFAHIDACPECREAYELVKKTKAVFKRTDDLEGAVMKKIKKAERAKRISLITKIAAVFIAVLAAGIFAKIIIDNGLERQSKDEAFDDRFTDFEAEGSFTGDGEKYNGALNDTDNNSDISFSSPDNTDIAPMEPSEEPMAPREEMPETDDAPVKEEQIPTDQLKDDVNMFLNDYKDMNSLPVHTADIVVSGDNIKYAREVLEKFSPEQCDYHIEIQGDFYFEVQEALQGADFEIVLTTSSETIRKTLIYFEDLIK